MRVLASLLCGLMVLNAVPGLAEKPTSQDYILSLEHATFVRYPARWQPDAAEAAEARAATITWLGSAPAPDLVLGSWFASPSLPSSYLRNMSEYDLQYVGVYMSHEVKKPDYAKSGDRVILIHGFKRTSVNLAADRPDIQEVVVLDGGGDFFEARYDVDAHKLLSFHTNGYA